MKHTLTYTAELAGVVARLAAELAAGAVTEGTLAEAENVLRALYQSDILWGGGWTGALPRELGWDRFELCEFDRHAQTSLESLVSECMPAEAKARVMADRMTCMVNMLLRSRGANA